MASKSVEDRMFHEALKAVMKGRMKENVTLLQAVNAVEEYFYKASLPKAAENIVNLIVKEPKQDDTTGRKLQFEASREAMKGAGILSDNQSVTIKNTFTQNNLILSPVLREIIGNHVKGLTFEGNTVDAECVNKEEGDGIFEGSEESHEALE
jgi:hypothetical protein